jgi:sugar/nucleoside kinase (ribokinase family)
VGKDGAGEEIIKIMAGEGIDTQHIAVDSDHRSNYSAVINLHGERSILVYHEHRHYKFPAVAPAKWIYLSSMGSGGEDIFPDIIEYAQKNDAKLCYQPGTFQLKLGKDHSMDLLKASHIFLVNKEEAEMYLGLDEPTDDFGLLLNGIMALGPKIALVTDGTNGAYASDGMEYLYLGIIKDAPRNEATGAGDSFSSAFCAALAKGKSLSDAMLWGQAQATGCIHEIGGQAGLLSQEKLEAVLAANPKLQTVSLSPSGTAEITAV